MHLTTSGFKGEESGSVQGQGLDLGSVHEASNFPRCRATDDQKIFTGLITMHEMGRNLTWFAGASPSYTHLARTTRVVGGTWRAGNLSGFPPLLLLLLPLGKCKLPAIAERESRGMLRGVMP